MSRPVHSALLAANSASVPPRPQEPYYAPPISNAPPTRGAFRGQSSRPGPSQSQLPHPPRACFECGDTRHVVRGCPRLGRSAPPQTSLPQRAPQSSQAMIITMVATPPAQPARGGVWGGSTYSYVSSYFSLYLGVPQNSLCSSIYVSTPMGDSLVVDRVYRSCLVDLSGFETRADLLLLSMVDFDIILGMEWLLPHYAILDCHAKTMMLATPGVPRVEWRESGRSGAAPEDCASDYER
ncbi:uncharacterized protein [Nicotiana sylvestris]|uniref:uncharacterized protein n=1 Tax=Nicotiana sylvestris TaxID=4096 RepID=UPI00388C90D2